MGGGSQHGEPDGVQFGPGPRPPLRAHRCHTACPGQYCAPTHIHTARPHIHHHHPQYPFPHTHTRQQALLTNQQRQTFCLLETICTTPFHTPPSTLPPFPHTNTTSPSALPSFHTHDTNPLTTYTPPSLVSLFSLSLLGGRNRPRRKREERREECGGARKWRGRVGEGGRDGGVVGERPHHLTICTTLLSAHHHPH